MGGGGGGGGYVVLFHQGEYDSLLFLKFLCISTYCMFGLVHFDCFVVVVVLCFSSWSAQAL